MTEKYQISLFLRNDEQEELLDLVDKFEVASMSSEFGEEELMQMESWAQIITRLVFGKAGYFPLHIRKKKDESTN